MKLGRTVLALLVLAGTLATAVHAAPRANQQVSLLVVHLHPLVVEGQHFNRGERVQLTVYGRRQVTHIAWAGQLGKFFVTFPLDVVDVCAGFTIRATRPHAIPVRLVSPARGCPPAPAP